MESMMDSQMFMEACISKRKRYIIEFLEMSEKEKKRMEENEGKKSVCMSHGSVSVIGRRRVMEDAVKVSVGEIEGYDLFAVFDGHGGAGVANACRDRMHHLIVTEVEEMIRRGKVMEWEKLMTRCFEKMDNEVRGSGGSSEDTAKRTMGSTAVVALVGEDEMVVANCGDSRAVLCRGGSAVALTLDHKPDRPDEKERVEAAGGRIVDWNGNRVLGVLATSRSIGDQYLKPFVISKPEVSVIERTKSDDFIVLGSDGLWDAVSNETACKVVRKYLNGQLQVKLSDLPEGCTGQRAAEAAAMLAEIALARGSTDNISVIVVELRR